MAEDTRRPDCSGDIHQHTHFICDETGMRVPVERIEHAVHVETPDGILNIGGHDFYVQMSSVSIYTMSWSTDPRSTARIMIDTNGDGLAQHVLDQENWEAALDPRGPKEYWREKMVGRATYGLDNHPMTDEEFEADWFDE